MVKLFEDDLRSKRGKEEKAKSDIAKAYHISQRLPQAVVKVSSWGKGRGRVKAHIDYITRKGDIELEDPAGNKLGTREERDMLLDEWFLDSDRRKNSRDTAHIVLSSPRGSDRVATENAVRDFARKVFGSTNDYVFVMHNDTKSPHAHLVVKAKGYDGSKLRLNKKELHELRENFAKELRQRNIMVEASYRNQRGQGKKGKRQDLVNMRKRGVRLNVDRALTNEITAELRKEKQMQISGSRKYSDLKPWEVKQKKVAQQRRDEYTKLALELNKSGSTKMKGIASSIKSFAESMPEPKTFKAEVKQQMSEKLSQEKSKGQGREL